VRKAIGDSGEEQRLVRTIARKGYRFVGDVRESDAGGLIAGQFQTDPGKVAEAIEIVRTEWRRMADKGPTQQELDDAKTYLLGYYPRNFTSTMETAQVLRSLQLERLGIDYVTRRQQEIAAVTIEDARRAAKGLFDASQLTFVVVGPADRIQLPGAEVVKAPAQN
jgi:zinc protease